MSFKVAKVSDLLVSPRCGPSMKKLIAFLTITFLVATANCHAGLTITLSQIADDGNGNDVQISWSSFNDEDASNPSGVLSGDPGLQLDFLNFDFDVFGMNRHLCARVCIGAFRNYRQTGLTYQNSYESIRLEDETSGGNPGDDLIFVSSTTVTGSNRDITLDANDTYSVLSSSSRILGLSFDDLVANGTFTSSNTAGDAQRLPNRRFWRSHAQHHGRPRANLFYSVRDGRWFLPFGATETASCCLSRS